MLSSTRHTNSILSISFPPYCSHSVFSWTHHSLRYLIIENFIPPEEKNKIMNRLYFDGEEDQWKFQPLVPTGGYVPNPHPALTTCGHEASPCKQGKDIPRVGAETLGCLQLPAGGNLLQAMPHQERVPFTQCRQAAFVTVWACFQ